MSMFTGIPAEGLFLLSRNKFEDSKEFYEAHKARLKALVFTPLQNIAEDLAADFARLDPRMNLLPGRMISRARRDTRFTKEKHLYRDNIWITFTRPKEEPMLWPCMWFEVKPEQGEWNAGVCIYEAQPAYMQFVRARIQDDAEGFLSAAGEAIAAGAVMQPEAFKREKYPDAPENLKPYLNAKGFIFMHTSKDLDLLAKPALIDELRRLYGAYGAMYRWLLKAAEGYYEK
ncbi:MAG: DUF2461 domain-containing protein [Firmicutes bacterium]|nr:DUF2461 domain-containing protein [Bacillota bacterium]